MITGHKVSPCRRCGAGQAFLHLSWTGRAASVYAVRCGHCGARGPAACTEEGAVRAWNHDNEKEATCQSMKTTPGLATTKA